MQLFSGETLKKFVLFNIFVFFDVHDLSGWRRKAQKVSITYTIYISFKSFSYYINMYIHGAMIFRVPVVSLSFIYLWQLSGGFFFWFQNRLSTWYYCGFIVSVTLSMGPKCIFVCLQMYVHAKNNHFDCSNLIYIFVY